MSRTSFELEIKATTANSAKALAEVLVSDYLEITQEQVQELVDMEFKVKSSPETGILVTVFGSVKRSIINL